MSKSLLQRILWAFLFSLGTASCGFTPVYAPGSKTAAALSDVVVAPPKNDRADYLLVRALESRIGRNPNGGTILEHDIRIYEVGHTADRVQMIGTVTYKVVSIEDNRVLFGGSVKNFVTYTDGVLITSLTQNATERLMSILADQITAELMGRFSGPVSG